MKALVAFRASLEFQTWDSYDGEYVSLNTTEEETERWITFDLAMTVSRDLEEEPELLEAEVSRRGFSALFGDIAPFPHENPYHEKY